MIYQNFSKRQLLTLTWWNKPQFMDCDGIICDGSIRSGKTVSMTDGFILWSMSRFNGQNFAICGKTIESLRRNVITLMPQWLEGIFSITERRSENKLIITSGGVTNSYYMFGGKDESSYTGAGHHACGRAVRRSGPHASLFRGAGYGSLQRGRF